MTSPSNSVEADRSARAGGAAPSEIVPGAIAVAGLCVMAAFCHQIVIGLTRLECDRSQVLAAAAASALLGMGLMFYSSPLRYRPVLSQLYLTGTVLLLGALAFRGMGHTVHYLAAGTPLWDERLAALDKALGFDWVALLAWANAHPALSSIGCLAYTSFTLQIVVVPVLVALSRRRDRLFVLLSANVIALMAVHAIAVLTPALGAYQFYGMDPSRHPNIAVMVADLPGAEILGVRDGAILNVSRDFPLGIITFPSYHATGAILFAWGLWHVPYARCVGLGLNLAMIAATPLHGSHYFVDVLAGAALAPVALWLARAVQAAALDIYMQVRSRPLARRQIRYAG